MPVAEMNLAGVASVLAVVVSVAFGWAAVAKATDRAGTANTMSEFDLPAPRAIALTLPVVEAAVAAALLLRPWVGAIAATTLLMFFTTFLATKLAAGVRVPCRCFGAASAAPLSSRELLRNAVLVSMAIPVVSVQHLQWPTLIDTAIVASVLAVAAAVLRRAR